MVMVTTDMDVTAASGRTHMHAVVAAKSLLIVTVSCDNVSRNPPTADVGLCITFNFINNK